MDKAPKNNEKTGAREAQPRVDLCNDSATLVQEKSEI